MPTNDLHPSYIIVNYHSTFALHKATLPTTKWNAGIGTNGQGGYNAWDASPRDAVDMMGDWVDAAVLLVSAEIVFDNFIIYDSVSDADPLFPVGGAAFTAKVGTVGTPGWFQAVQAVFTFFDSGFNTSKLNLLDYASKNNFARRSAASASADETAFAAVWMDPVNAFASRTNLQPVALRSISLGINDELKKQYPGI
jgi:hypothetical protein